MTITHVDLPGSFRPAREGAERLGTADPAQTVEVTLTIRGKRELPEPNASVSPIPIEEIESEYGAEQKDFDLVENVLGKFGLTIAGKHLGARTMEAKGTIKQMEEAFDVTLSRYRSSKQGEYIGRDGDYRVPVQLKGIVESVLGLDQRHVGKHRRGRSTNAGTASLALGPQSPDDLERRYSFPPGTAKNQKIGILEFFGGYFDADLQQYCADISKRSKPNVTVVPVGQNPPTSIDQIRQIADPAVREGELGASVEVNMDVQIVAGLCPEASILVYFAPFTQKGWINALQKAIFDPKGPKVISVSWGAAEDFRQEFSAAALQAINNMLKTAATAGVTICVSSGDDGAGDGVNDGTAHVDFPASSPYVLAVGGTMFSEGKPETGWWDKPGARTEKHGGGSSGGGRSVIFETPSWQNVDVVSVRTGKAEGRCIPDVAALSGEPLYQLIFDGRPSPNGGTSASAPLWASLLARTAANLPDGQQIGFFTPRLYQPGNNGKPIAASVTTNIATGQNDDLAFKDATTNPPQDFKPVKGYEGMSGYNAVTGWGVPIGTALLDALSGGSSVAHSIFSALPKGATRPRTSGNYQTHDAFAAQIIDHDFLDDTAAKEMQLEAAARTKPWTEIPFPAGTAPTVLPDSGKATLPASDIVLFTYTSDEANAMAAVLTPGFVAIPPHQSSTPGWTSYTNNYASFVPDLLHGSSPALDSHNLGLYKLIKLGGKRVLCYKSSLHLARDGKSMPVKRLVKQILSETDAGLFITTGTAGGIGAAVQLGDAAITTSCTFDLVRMFASESFNGSTIKSSFQLRDAKYLDIANTKLIGVNSSRLKSSPIPPNRTPTIAAGNAIFGGEPNVCVTTDGFLFDDAQNTDQLQGKGCMVEMDDAVVGLAIQELQGNRQSWLSIRNASDPQMPVGASKKEASDIYLNYGFYTTFTSVLACWACVLGA